MNDQLQHKKMNAEPTKSKLLGELAIERGMARRQELLKAIWRLERQATLPVSSPPARLQVPVAVKPDSEAERRQPLSVQEPDRRPKTRTNSPIATATHQNVDDRSRETMNDKQTLAALNDLHAIGRFSLASYLRYAKPWVSAADQCLGEAIRHIGDQQLGYSERVGSLIIERRGHVEGGSFPSRFTAYNDLSLAYLAPRVMEDQEQIVRQVSEIARQLRGDSVACDLVDEILGAEQTHLDNLRELLGEQESERCRKSSVAALDETRCQEHATSVATAA